MSKMSNKGGGVWEKLNSASSEVPSSEDKQLELLMGEINLIKSPSIKSFVRRILLSVSTFWFAPSGDESSEVPEDERSIGGLVLHTRRMVSILRLMMESQDISQIESDILVAAAILHDCTRARVEDVSNSVTFDPAHTVTVDMLADALAEKEDSESVEVNASSVAGVDDEVRESILRLVRIQDGPVAIVPELMPEGMLENMFYMADYLASRIHLVTEVHVGKRVNI